MPTKKKTEKVVDVAEVKEEIALVDEEAKNETPAVSDDSGDQSTTDNKKEPVQDSKVDGNLSKACKAKNFVKKHWKKFAIGGGLIAAGVVGYKLGVKISTVKRLEIAHNAIDKYMNDRIDYLIASNNDGCVTEAVSKATGETVYALTKLVDKTELPEWFLNHTDSIVTFQS